MSAPRDPLRAPRGAALSCRGWPQEAATRNTGIMRHADAGYPEALDDTFG